MEYIAAIGSWPLSYQIAFGIVVLACVGAIGLRWRTESDRRLDNKFKLTVIADITSRKPAPAVAPARNSYVTNPDDR